MENYLKRMITEEDDLEGKIRRAETALKNQGLHLDKVQAALLTDQIEHMQGYLEVLKARISYEKRLTGGK